MGTTGLPGDAQNSSVELLGLIVLAISCCLICISVVHRYRVLAARSARRRQLQAAAAENAEQQRALHPPGEPLPESIKNALPVTTFRADTSLLEDRTCSICLMDYAERDQLTTLPCKHSFHTECIGLWFASHGTCPFCRLSLLPPVPSSPNDPSSTPSEGGDVGQTDLALGAVLGQAGAVQGQTGAVEGPAGVVLSQAGAGDAGLTGAAVGAAFRQASRPAGAPSEEVCIDMRQGPESHGNPGLTLRDISPGLETHIDVNQSQPAAGTATEVAGNSVGLHPHHEEQARQHQQEQPRPQEQEQVQQQEQGQHQRQEQQLLLLGQGGPGEATKEAAGRQEGFQDTAGHGSAVSSRVGATGSGNGSTGNKARGEIGETTGVQNMSSMRVVVAPGDDGDTDIVSIVTGSGSGSH